MFKMSVLNIKTTHRNELLNRVVNDLANSNLNEEEVSQEIENFLEVLGDDIYNFFLEIRK